MHLSREKIEEMLHAAKRERKIFEEIEHLLLRILRLLGYHHNHHCYTVRITQEETNMIGNIPAGETGTFGAALLDNGAPYTPPAGSAYVPQFSWTASDSTVTFETSADTASTVVTVPGNSAATSVVIGVSVIAPDGTTAIDSLTVTVTPATQQFTVKITQTA